jgi:hypothetical protein
MLKSLFITFFFTLKVLAEIKCFGLSPRLSPIDPSDCGDIFQIMEGMDKVWAPMHFSRDKSTGFELPHRWHIKSCTILIDMLDEGDEDDFPLAVVIQAASDLVRTCVMAPGMPKRGGRNYIGPKEKMFLVLAGKKAPDIALQNLRFPANASRFFVLPSVHNITTA